MGDSLHPQVESIHQHLRKEITHRQEQHSEIYRLPQHTEHILMQTLYI